MIMNIVRIAKVVALLAFVLPWVAVSCNGTDIATASGIELIQGTMSENPEAAKQMGFPGGETSQGTSDKPELGMNFFALGAGDCGHCRAWAHLRGWREVRWTQRDHHQPGSRSARLWRGVELQGIRQGGHGAGTGAADRPRQRKIRLAAT